MAQWQRHINLQPEWGKASNDEISRQEMAAIVAARLKAIKPFGHPFDDLDYERDEIAERFADFSRDANAYDEEFNGLMEELYDWGDQKLDDKWNGKKVCWIDTISAPRLEAAE